MHIIIYHLFLRLLTSIDCLRAMLKFYFINFNNEILDHSSEFANSEQPSRKQQ